MANHLLYPGSILSIHRKAADALLKAGSGDASLLYLCHLAGKDPGHLGWSPERLETAHQVLVSLHLLDPTEPVKQGPPPKLEPQAPPDYTTADVALAIREGGFGALVPEVERMLGKTLSPSDLKTLYLLFDFLALPPEVILTLVNWCVERTAQRSGTGRKPTLHQIKTEGFRWQRAGVDSLDTADAYMRRVSQLNRRVVRFLEILGIQGRKPSASERKYLTTWAGLGLADDAIQLAYDRTVLNTNRLSWGYMNAILLRWKDAGYKTAGDVLKEEGGRRSPNTQPRTGQGPGAAAMPSDDIGRMMAQARQQDPTPPPGPQGPYHDPYKEG